MSAITPNNEITCAVMLHGRGILCGLEVHVNEDCSVHVEKGSAVTEHGALLQVGEKQFRSYLKVPDPMVAQYFSQWFPQDPAGEKRYWQLEEGYDPKTMDSLKAQNPGDLPTRTFLEDKILVTLLDENKPETAFSILVSWSDMVLIRGLTEQVKTVNTSGQVAKTVGGIFKSKKTKPVYSVSSIEKVLFPYLQLSDVQVLRFGYKTLAIKDPAQRFGTANFQNPFQKVSSFQHIFDEYKAILDDLVPEFCDALATLHELFGNLLTHKGESYWKKYRDILVTKWEVFLEEGEHLYYIQYFYDWLCDLVKAYEELRSALTHYKSDCSCKGDSTNYSWTLVALGPVLGSRTSYKPLIFRDYFVEPFHVSHNADRLVEIRLLHWRMMMMIWTFDLPFLKADQKVLRDKFGLITAEEFKDSTEIFETTDIDKNAVFNFEDLPLKFTPSRYYSEPLGNLAIPFYYPLDADSPYAVHRYWDYTKTRQNRQNLHRSYNAVENADSYTKDASAKYPLAFLLREYPFLRAEGHIGKKLIITEQENAGHAIADLSKWLLLIQQYNLAMEIVALPVSKLEDIFSPINIGKNGVGAFGMEHLAGLEQGQTFLLIYADKDEQIELNECKKDHAPEIEKYTIVADFTFPGFFLNSL